MFSNDTKGYIAIGFDLLLFLRGVFSAVLMIQPVWEVIIFQPIYFIGKKINLLKLGANALINKD